MGWDIIRSNERILRHRGWGGEDGRLENCLNSGASLGSEGGKWVSLAIEASTALGFVCSLIGWLGFRVLFYAISLVFFPPHPYSHSYSSFRLPST